MVALSDILSPSRTITGVAGTSKKRVLQSIAQCISETTPDLSADDIFDSLVAREKLGSTGFGNGVALPHCRLLQCTDIIGAFFRLSQPVDFDAIDRKKVDLIFVLLVPDDPGGNSTHLNTLSALAEKFNESSFRDSLRQAADSDALFQLMTQS